MKKIQICSPVMGKTLDEFLKNLDKVQEVSDMVELRVDKIKDLNESNLILIRKKIVKKAIFTSRSKDTIIKALNLKFDYIDIDFSLINQINFKKTKNIKIIISHHDFQKTPEEKELKKIIIKMSKCKPDIIKIATLVKKESDNFKLFQLLLDNKKEKKIIIVGMGQKGKITRILGPLLGSFVTYASTSFGKSAPGQIEINRLKKIYGR